MKSMYFREYFCSFSSKSYYFYILCVSHLNCKARSISMAGTVLDRQSRLSSYSNKKSLICQGLTLFWIAFLFSVMTQEKENALTNARVELIYDVLYIKRQFHKWQHDWWILSTITWIVQKCKSGRIISFIWCRRNCQSVYIILLL